MHLQAVLQVSQDGRNWTLFDADPPIPLALLSGYAFVRVVLVYAVEPGDNERIDVTPAQRPPLPSR